jgi:hypothetical protein
MIFLDHAMDRIVKGALPIRHFYFTGNREMKWHLYDTSAVYILVKVL